MTPEDDLRLMVETLEKRGVEIREESCGSEGGLVRIKGEQLLFLNPIAPVLERIGVCLRALRRLGTEGYYLPPRIRVLLEDEE